MLGWRVFHDALPVATNLRRRNCKTNIKCCFCGYEEESCIHIFTECWWSKALWKMLDCEEEGATSYSCIADWFWKWVSGSSTSKMETMAVGMWMIWFNRNLWVHGKHGMSLEVCSSRVRSMLMQFGTKAILGYKPNSNADGVENCIDVYCDGSWKNNEGGGLAVVAMKGEEILKCKVLWVQEAESSREMEWKALSEGLDLIESLDARYINFHVDCAEMVWEIQAGKWRDSIASQVGQRFMEEAEKRKNWSINYIMRESNVLADAMAKKARMEKWCWLNPYAIPRCVSSAREAWLKCK